MMDATTYTEIAKQGTWAVVFLVVTIPLAWAYRAQSKELKETQDRRAADAQATTDKLLALNDKWNGVTGDQVRMMSALAATMSDLKQAMQGIHELLIRSAK